jgi:hypothetical protein
MEVVMKINKKINSLLVLNDSRGQKTLLKKHYLGTILKAKSITQAEGLQIIDGGKTT